MFISITIWKFFVLTSVLVQSHKILVIVQHNARSHFKTFEPFFLKLVQRGHKVTILSHFPMQEELPNCREISLHGSLPLRIGDLQFSTMNGYWYWQNLLLMNLRSVQYEHVLKLDNLQRFLDSNETFDLLMMETFVSRLFVSFAEKFRSPFMYFSPSPLFPHVTCNVGDYINPAFTLHARSGYTDHMRFSER